MTYHVIAEGSFIGRTHGPKLREHFDTRAEAVRFARDLIGDLAVEPTLYGEPAETVELQQYATARLRLDAFENGDDGHVSVSLPDDELAIVIRYVTQPAPLPARRPADPIVFPGDSEGRGEDALHTLRVWNGAHEGGVDNPSNWTIYELTTAQVRQLADQLARAVDLHTPRPIDVTGLVAGDRLADGRTVTGITALVMTGRTVRYDDGTIDNLPPGTTVEVLS